MERLSIYRAGSTRNLYHWCRGWHDIIWSTKNHETQLPLLLNQHLHGFNRCYKQQFYSFNKFRLQNDIKTSKIYTTIRFNTIRAIYIGKHKYIHVIYVWLRYNLIWSRHCLDASTAFLSGQCVYIWAKVEYHKII